MTTIRLFGAAVALFVSLTLSAHAQVPASVPSGTTGVCNDGSYSTAPSKRGACAGHKGVKTWYVASAATSATQPTNSTPSTPTAPAAATATAAQPAPSTPSGPTTRTAAAQRVPAAGGGNGQVWVNTSTNVYHCQGDRSYGTTKAGQYMSEADAKTKGARPAYGKVCTE